MYRPWKAPLIGALALGWILTLATPAVFAARTKEKEATASAADMDPRAEATASYNRAVKYRDRAWEYEQKAAAADSEKAAEKSLDKAQKEYGKAIRALRSAVEGDPTLHQAWTTLGYALRKTGEFGESLAAYDRALELEPGFPEALEYRAEAFLGLGRVEEAQEAYMELLRADRELADQLLTAMRDWVEARRSDPGPVAAETLEEFASWVAERSKLAEQASLGPQGSDAW